MNRKSTSHQRALLPVLLAGILACGGAGATRYTSDGGTAFQANRPDYANPGIQNAGSQLEVGVANVPNLPTIPQPVDRSFRIMSWNIAFIPDGDDVNDGTWEDDEARAKFVAQKVLDKMAEHDADVIAFNEAFNIEAQRELSAALCGHYSNFVRYLDEPDDATHQDAGLMLFSRHPFVNLNLSNADYYAEDFLAFTGCVSEGADDSDPLFWNEVGFNLYPDSSCYDWDTDCMANKGAAAVRVRHNGLGDNINLIFSHLQASYSDGNASEYEDGRKVQLNRMKSLIEAIPNYENERSFVFGDLNVQGEGCSFAGCKLQGVGGCNPK